MTATESSLLDARAMERAVKRMADEIVELNAGIEDLVLVGIQRRGVQLAERLVRAIRERDIGTLQSVPRLGRKKAEQLVLDLADKMGDVGGAPADAGPRPEGAAADDAIRALVSLGYTTVDAEKAVRAAIDGGGKGMATSELIRAALGQVGGRR